MRLICQWRKDQFHYKNQDNDDDAIQKRDDEIDEANDVVVEDALDSNDKSKWDDIESAQL